MLDERGALRQLRERLVVTLGDHPSACAIVEGAATIGELLRALARLHAAAVAAADGAEELARLSSDMALAHLAAAHRMADSGDAPEEALQAHVVETQAATAGRARADALRARATWLAELVVTVDRQRLEAELELLASRRPPLEAPIASGGGAASRRLPPTLLLELDVARLRHDLTQRDPEAVADPTGPAPVRPTSWLYVPALRHRVGSERPDLDGPSAGPIVELDLPAYWIARRAQPAPILGRAGEIAARLGGEMPNELVWEAAVRLLGPWLVRGPRFEWCADPADRRLLLRTAETGAYPGLRDGPWRASRSLVAPTRRGRLPAWHAIPIAGVRPVRIARGEVIP